MKKTSNEKTSEVLSFVRMAENHLEAVFNLAQKSNLSFWSLEDYRSEILRSDSVCLIVKSKEKIIGFLVARLIRQNKYAELYNIAVDKDFRRNKIGARLLEKLVKCCKDNDLQNILLEVRESNTAAIKLYSKLSFTILGINKNFYNAPTENGLTMIKNLF